ncbi:MAG TPA: pyridoxal 5'-phosphate synthase glutaminase subunit PdxT [Coriobacteriaceae bacterium]|nr:pyridoxal 5'-phosphate synthase glutaminase subunit PdxT [Coriobacteriaceae bacterium]
MTTAILAVQGAFAEHAAMLDELGEPWFELRCLRNMSRHFDRLILPGGESTVQGRLLREEGMLTSLRKLIDEGMPVLGTCAGLILLAERVIDDDDGSRPIRPDSHLGTMHVTVERNAYGRQLASFHATDEFAGIGPVPMSFIRAPRIVEVREGAVELARIDGDIVAARDGKQIGVAFHPELDDDPRIHELFLAL